METSWGKEGIIDLGTVKRREDWYSRDLAWPRFCCGLAMWPWERFFLRPYVIWKGLMKYSPRAFLDLAAWGINVCLLFWSRTSGIIDSGGWGGIKTWQRVSGTGTIRILGWQATETNSGHSGKLKSEDSEGQELGSSGVSRECQGRPCWVDALCSHAQDSNYGEKVYYLDKSGPLLGQERAGRLYW